MYQVIHNVPGTGTNRSPSTVLCQPEIPALTRQTAPSATTLFPSAPSNLDQFNDTIVLLNRHYRGTTSASVIQHPGFESRVSNPNLKYARMIYETQSQPSCVALLLQRCHTTQAASSAATTVRRYSGILNTIYSWKPVLGTNLLVVSIDRGLGALKPVRPKLAFS